MTAELATVTVVDFAPELVGVNDRAPVVQVLPEVRTAPAVQVPRAWVNCESLELNGVEPRVTVPPLAVRVTVPQEPVVPTPWVEEQVSELTLLVR